MQTTSKIVEGYVMLPDSGDHLVITKSYKDVIALRLYDVLAVSPPSELIILPKKFIRRVSEKFHSLYTLFDNDRVGKRATLKYRRLYDTIPLLFPPDMEKDFTDNLVVHGNRYMLDMVESLKEKFL